MLTKLKLFFTVTSRLVIHIFSRSHRDDFWGWLYLRVCNPNSRDFENRQLVWFLLDNAIRTREHVRVVAVYSNFQSIIDETATPKYRAEVVASIEAAKSLGTCDERRGMP